MEGLQSMPAPYRPAKPSEKSSSDEQNSVHTWPKCDPKEALFGIRKYFFFYVPKLNNDNTW